MNSWKNVRIAFPESPSPVYSACLPQAGVILSGASDPSEKEGVA